MRRVLVATLVTALVAATATPAVAASPVAYDDEVTGVEFQDTTFNILANDVDPDGDTLTLDSYNQPVEGGALSCEDDGTCTYSSSGGIYEDSFSYSVSDGSATDTGLVTITIEVSGGGDNFPKTIGLRLRGQLVARGAISSSAPKCERDQPVRIFRKEDGYWNLVKKTTTNTEGGYRIRIPHRFARYRAETPVRGECDKDTSPVRSYLTNDPQTILDPDDIAGFLDIAKVRIDHDGFDLHFKWTAHDSWQMSSLTGGKRLGVYLFLSGSYYSIDIDVGDDLPIVPIVKCSGSPGSGGSCDYGSIKYGEGEKAGPRSINFQLPLRHLDLLGNPFTWQGHSASNPGSGFDFTIKKSYRR